MRRGSSTQPPRIHNSPRPRRLLGQGRSAWRVGRWLAGDRYDRAVEVIGAGFGRTGTASLKIALEQLGFEPCHHMYEVFKHPAQARLWRAAARGELTDWDDLYGGYRATVDWPGAAFWEELVARYPDAKVILTVRDPERWYDSVRRTIYARTMSSRRWLTPPPIRRVVSMIFEIIWAGTFDGRFEDRDHAIAVFNRHNERVRANVPADRLLVYEVGEGWGPLCAFLDVAEPATDFPHVNTTEEFRRRIRLRRAIAFATAALLTTGTAAVVKRRGYSGSPRSGRSGGSRRRARASGAAGRSRA